MTEMTKYRIAIQRYSNGEPVDYANLMVDSNIKNVGKFRDYVLKRIKNGRV